MEGYADDLPMKESYIRIFVWYNQLHFNPISLLVDIYYYLIRYQTCYATAEHPGLASPSFDSRK